MQDEADDKTVILHQDMNEAERVIFAFIQHKKFLTEMNTLVSENVHVGRSSRIRSLAPFLHEGLLRVGGRLHRSCMPAKTKHPGILPKDHRVSTLIPRRIHHELMHIGRKHMLVKLRELVHAQSAIRKVISKCVACRRLRSNVEHQNMASLPLDRIIPDELSFSRTGVEYFGPFEVKLRRNCVKNYTVITTCLTSRAVHLGLAASSDTYS